MPLVITTPAIRNEDFCLSTEVSTLKRYTSVMGSKEHDFYGVNAKK